MFDTDIMKNIGEGIRMKKTIIGLCLALAMIFTLSMLFTWVTPVRNTMQKSTFDPAVTPQNGLSISTEFPSYKKDTKEIKLIIKNNTNEELYYGYQYQIEVKRKDGWYVVPVKDELSFIAIAVMLPPNAEAEYVVSLEHLAQKPATGRYRVVFNNQTAEFDLTD